MRGRTSIDTDFQGKVLNVVKKLTGDGASRFRGFSQALVALN